MKVGCPMLDWHTLNVCKSDSVIKRPQDLPVGRVVIHAFDVIEPPLHGDREQHCTSATVCGWDIQLARRSSQGTNRAAPTATGFVAALYPVLAILDQRPADHQHLQSQDVRLRRGRRVEQVSRERFGNRRHAGYITNDSLPQRGFVGRCQIGKPIKRHLCLPGMRTRQSRSSIVHSKARPQACQCVH